MVRKVKRKAKRKDKRKIKRIKSSNPKLMVKEKLMAKVKLMVRAREMPIKLKKRIRRDKINKKVMGNSRIRRRKQKTTQIGNLCCLH